MKLGYADPPYIGCAFKYEDHPDYAGEVDHVALVHRLQNEFDGWILHAAATPESMAILAPLVEKARARWCAWFKPFAAFKAHVSVAYAWEPVIIKAARKPVVSGHIVMRDFISCPIALKRGLVGAKPEKVIQWAFDLVGADPADELCDLFPGTGAVARAWDVWRARGPSPEQIPLFAVDLEGL
jgi:hypothetical protein